MPEALILLYFSGLGVINYICHCCSNPPSLERNGALLHSLCWANLKFDYTMFEYESSDNDMSKDALFLERLDAFMDKCLIDIKAFAERELRPYQEVFKDPSIGNISRF